MLGCEKPKDLSWVPFALRPHRPPLLSMPSAWLCGVPWGHCFQNPSQEANPSPLCVQSPNLTGVPVTLRFTTDFVEVLGTRPLLVSLIFLLNYSLPQPRDNLDLYWLWKYCAKFLCSTTGWCTWEKPLKHGNIIPLFSISPIGLPLKQKPPGQWHSVGAGEWLGVEVGRVREKTKAKIHQSFLQSIMLPLGYQWPSSCGITSPGDCFGMTQHLTWVWVAHPLRPHLRGHLDVQ